MTKAKSWAHLAATAAALNVVIAKGMQGLASVKEANGTHLFCMRNAVMQMLTPAELESYVARARESVTRARAA